jgi:hypothetical protein
MFLYLYGRASPECLAMVKNKKRVVWDALGCGGGLAPRAGTSGLVPHARARARRVVPISELLVGL